MAITKSNVLTHLNSSGLVIEEGNWAGVSTDTTGTLTPDQTTSPKIGKVLIADVNSSTSSRSVTKSKSENSFSLTFTAGDTGTYVIIGKSF